MWNFKTFTFQLQKCQTGSNKLPDSVRTRQPLAMLNYDSYVNVAVGKQK